MSNSSEIRIGKKPALQKCFVKKLLRKDSFDLFWEDGLPILRGFFSFNVYIFTKKCVKNDAKKG